MWDFIHKLGEALVIFVILWVPKKGIDALMARGWSEATRLEKQRKEARKAAIYSHYEDGHTDKLKTCSTDSCLLLSSIDAVTA